MKPIRRHHQAEGLAWPQLVVELMKLIMPWKGRLAATFFFRVTRVVAFIGVGVLSALILAALKNGESLWRLTDCAGDPGASFRRAALAGILDRP